jgi:NAD(P)-dependent dehydrogenase (short-subunit alcohol dehydrogenase family)
MAVVTGAGSGIGRAVALRLAQEGARVVGVGRDRLRLETVATEASGAAGQIDGIEVDLIGDDGIRGLASRLAGDAASVDVLVHSAGVHAVGEASSLPVEELDRQYRTNVRAPYLLTQLLIPMLESAAGQIVFVSSSVVRRAVAGVGAYAATKHAVRGLADALREELNPRGVRVLTVYPGRTAGPMQETLHQLESRPYRLDRLLQPDDVAAIILDALSLPRSAEVTDIDIRPMVKP